MTYDNKAGRSVFPYKVLSVQINADAEGIERL